MSIRHLDQLLEPASVAVIGASARPASVGATVWRNLRSGSFPGPLWAVNPKHRTLDGEPVFARVADLPAAPDLAVVCTPPASVPGLIAELAERGTRAAIVMTAGLSPAQKQAMLDAARPGLLRVLGPNCLGLLTPRLGLNASFAHTVALPGDVAFVSQSGALVTAVLDWAKSRGIGFSHMVSLGERSDVDFGDLLDWLASDRHTRSILLYIESIEHARKFMSAARAAARNKPVIVVKAGRAGHGLHAASSHTGALAGADIVFDAAIRRAGMLRVDTLAELFTAAETLARFGAGGSDELLVVTNGGGAGVMAADAAALTGVPLADLGAPLLARLDAVLPPTWSRANPVDLIGDAPVERYTAALRAVFEAPGEHAVLFMHAPTAIVRSDDIARACLPLVRPQRHRVLGCWLGDDAVAAARALFGAAGIADYATPEEAVRAFAMMATYRRNQRLLIEAPAASPAAPLTANDRAAVRAVVDASLADGGGWLDAPTVKAVLQTYGVPTVASRAVSCDIAEAQAAAAAMGWPVALKIRSPDLTHKSDLGGVVLNLRDAGALAAAAEAMLTRVRAARPQARLDGFTVQTMAQRPQAEELIVGASVDPVFGPVLLFGAGGTAVEVDADRAIALPPLNGPLARELIARTRVARRLAGYRDRAPARLEAIEGVLVAVAQMLADLPELAELDINPLWADADGVLALDARIRVDAAAGGGATRFAIQPYPDHLEERVRWQGRTLLLRPVRPDDGERHRAFVEGLKPEDLRLRFFQTRRELPRSEIARLTQIDYAREMAFIAVAEPGPAGADGAAGSPVDALAVATQAGRTLGVARAVSDPDHVEAEFAIVVASALHGRGLGRLLMRKLIRYATQRGLQRLVGLVLRENGAMLALCKSLGFTIDHAGSDQDAWRVVLALR